MALIFSTRRHRKVAGANDVAARLTEPLSVADVLTPSGTEAARAQASRDRALRDDHALRSEPFLAQAKVQAGLVGTSLIDPVKQPADPRLIERFGAVWIPH